MEVKLKSPFYFERGYIRQIPYIVRNSDVDTKIALIFDVASFKFELQLFRLSKLEDIKYIRDHFKGL